MHTLIAELYATVEGATRVVFPDGTIKYFAKLADAEKFCFARGATTIASFVGKVGYLRASRYTKDSAVRSPQAPTAQPTSLVGTQSLSNN